MLANETTGKCFWLMVVGNFLYSLLWCSSTCCYSLPCALCSFGWLTWRLDWRSNSNLTLISLYLTGSTVLLWPLRLCLGFLVSFSWHNCLLCIFVWWVQRAPHTSTWLESTLFSRHSAEALAYKIGLPTCFVGKRQKQDFPMSWFWNRPSPRYTTHK